MTKIIFTFSGQGSQYHKMGQEFYDKNAVFRHWMDQADTLYEELSGSSLIQKCYFDDHASPLEDLDFSHVALFAVQYAIAKVVAETIKPDFLIGASLGEFVALAFSGFLPFNECLSHVFEQSKLFNQCAAKGMLIAVLAEMDQIVEILHEAHIDYSHAVDSGPAIHTLATDMENGRKMMSKLKEANMIFQQLPVKFPFHSKWIEVIEYPFRYLVNQLSFVQCGEIAVGSCATASIVDRVDDNHLWDILKEKVRLRETLVKWVNAKEDVIIDCSPSASTVGSVKAIFGADSPICRNAFKTLSPYKNGHQNLDLIDKSLKQQSALTAAHP